MWTVLSLWSCLVHSKKVMIEFLPTWLVAEGNKTYVTEERYLSPNVPRALGTDLGLKSESRKGALKGILFSYRFKKFSIFSTYTTLFVNSRIVPYKFRVIASLGEFQEEPPRIPHHLDQEG